MCMLLGFSADYDRSYFVRGADASLLERIFVRLSVVFMIPKLLITSVFIGPDNNYLTPRKEAMAGEMNCAISKRYEFSEIKSLSKRLGYTINDVVTCAITTALRKVFREQGDQSE